jgi:hypothetical protein
VLPLLTTERIRRAAQLLGAIAADLGSQEVTSETSGINDFSQAVEHVHTLLDDLLKDG